MQELLATAQEAQNEQQAATQVVLDEYEQQVSQHRERADATSHMFAAAEQHTSEYTCVRRPALGF